MSDIHFPTVSSDKAHPDDRPDRAFLPLKPGAVQGSASSSRVKSETRFAASDMLTVQEKQNVKWRRSSFPPIPPPSSHGGKLRSGNSRHSISEVVARMRVREKTLLAEGLLQGQDRIADGVIGSQPPTNGLSPAGHEGGRAGQVSLGPAGSPASRWPGSDVSTPSRTRKTGMVIPMHAWLTPRDSAPGSLEIRGGPVFSRSDSWRERVVETGHSGEAELGPQQQDDSEDVVGDWQHVQTEMDGADGSDEEEFDYDQGEDEVEAERQAGRQCHSTAAVYQRACERLRVQPSPAFLRQCNLSTMDLRDVRLGPADVKPIAIALVRDVKVLFLDLSNNDLGPVGVSYIAEMLQENNTLFDVNLSGTKPGPEGLKTLSETLRHNQSLAYLRLEENNIEHTESPLLANIITSVPRLQGLYLGHNKLGYRGGAAIASAIAHNNSLFTLDLQWNHIRRDSGVALVRALAKNSRLRQLNLAWNGLGKEGCLALAHALPQNASLRELDLTCNRVDLMSLGFLLRGLVRNSRLCTLKIGQNPITTDGAKVLIETISSSSEVAITEIDISGVPVDLEFTQILAQVQKTRLLHVKHEEAITLATSDRTREHDGTNLDRYDPVMVLFEYMKLDNLRVIDMFQYMDAQKRDKLSKANIRDGLNALRIPVTEHAIDVIVQKLDLNKDGFIELDEMMKVQRDTARQVKLRQIKAKAKNREDESLNGLHQILRDVISKRTEENESRRDSRRNSQAATRTSGGRKSSVGLLQLNQSRYSVTSLRTRADVDNLEAIPDE